MSNTKKKHLKKLQTWRIWPSVAISFFFILFSVSVVVAFFGLFILNITQTKYIDTFNESDKLMRSVLTVCENDYTWEDIIGFIYTTGVTDSAAITDSDYSVIASCGKLSFDSRSENCFEAGKFMDDLKRIINLNSCSAIVATHSPQIINNNWDNQIDLGGLYSAQLHNG